MGKTLKKPVLLLCVTLLSSLLWGKESKLAADTPTDDSADLVSVIVQFKQVPGDKHKNKILAKGGSVDSDLPLVEAVSGKLPKNRLHELATDPDVAYISP